MTDYVLVSQGIEIYRTKDKNEALEIMEQVNKEWNEYCQECYDNHEPHADNEVFMYEENENKILKHFNNKQRYQSKAFGITLTEFLKNLPALTFKDESVEMQKRAEETREFFTDVMEGNMIRGGKEFSSERISTKPDSTVINSSNNLQIAINNYPMTIKEYKGKRVCTFKDIDLCHQRPEGTAKRNFSANKKRFIEGEDYFHLTYRETCSTNFGQLNSPNGLIIITESGYLLLTKSFTDDLAWDIQRMLVDKYFRAPKVSVVKPMTHSEILAGIAQEVVKIERKTFELDDRTSRIESKLIEDSVFWKSNINQKINSITATINILEVSVKGYLYKSLERVANCNLTARVDNLKTRMKKSGATYKEQKAVTKLDVIANDKRLRQMFESIVDNYTLRWKGGE